MRMQRKCWGCTAAVHIYRDPLKKKGETEIPGTPTTSPDTPSPELQKTRSTTPRNTVPGLKTFADFAGLHEVLGKSRGVLKALGDRYNRRTRSRRGALGSRQLHSRAGPAPLWIPRALGPAPFLWVGRGSLKELAQNRGCAGTARPALGEGRMGEHRHSPSFLAAE